MLAATSKLSLSTLGHVGRLFIEILGYTGYLEMLPLESMPTLVLRPGGAVEEQRLRKRYMPWSSAMLDI